MHLSHTHTHSLWTTWLVLDSVGLHLCREVGCLAAIRPPSPSLSSSTWPTPHLCSLHPIFCPPPSYLFTTIPILPAFHVRSGSVSGIHCCCLIQWQHDACLAATHPCTHTHCRIRTHTHTRTYGQFVLASCATTYRAESSSVRRKTLAAFRGSCQTQRDFVCEKWIGKYRIKWYIHAERKHTVYTPTQCPKNYSYIK